MPFQNQHTPQNRKDNVLPVEEGRSRLERRFPTLPPPCDFQIHFLVSRCHDGQDTIIKLPESFDQSIGLQIAVPPKPLGVSVISELSLCFILCSEVASAGSLGTITTESPALHSFFSSAIDLFLFKSSVGAFSFAPLVLAIWKSSSSEMSWKFFLILADNRPSLGRLIPSVLSNSSFGFGCLGCSFVWLIRAKHLLTLLLMCFCLPYALPYQRFFSSRGSSLKEAHIVQEQLLHRGNEAIRPCSLTSEGVKKWRIMVYSVLPVLLE